MNNLIIGVAVVAAGCIAFAYNKKKSDTEVKVSPEELEIDTNSKTSIDNFIKEIVDDYYNEYRINYLKQRYDISEIKSDSTYVFKTKRIGDLNKIIDASQVNLGEIYLRDFITETYNLVVSNNDILPFITDISRIEGKIKAINSVSTHLTQEDLVKLMKLQEDEKTYYIEKYSS